MTNNGMNTFPDTLPLFGPDDHEPAAAVGPLFVPNMYPAAGMSLAANGNRSMEQLVAPSMALGSGSSPGFPRRPVSQGNTSFLGFGRSQTPSLQPLAIPGTSQHMPQQIPQQGLQQGQLPFQGGFAMQTNPGYSQSTSALSPYQSFASTPASAQSPFSAQDASSFYQDRRNIPANNGSFSAGGFFSGGNVFANLGSSNMAVGPVFDPSTGQTTQNPYHAVTSPASATHMSHGLSQASHASFTSHLSANSTPPQATVAYQTQAHPAHSASFPVRPQHMAGSSPAGMLSMSSTFPSSMHNTSQSPHPPPRDVLYGVGVQNMSTTLAPSQQQNIYPVPPNLTHLDSFPSQSSPDSDVVLGEPEFSQTAFNALIKANNQFATVPVLTGIQSPTGQEPFPSLQDSQYQDQSQRTAFQYGYTPSARSASRPRLATGETATTDHSFGLDSSSPLSSVSVAADGTQLPKHRSAPPSTAGDVAMRNRVAGVPGSMLSHFAVTDDNHNAGEDGTFKRRHSDDVDATTGQSKKTAKGKKSEGQGQNCLPCAIKHKTCNRENGYPCNECKKNTGHYPECMAPDVFQHNIFFHGLRSDLKEKATQIMESGQTMSMNFVSGIDVPLWILSEFKFGHPEMYKDLLMGDQQQDKSFYKPFYQASILLQARELLKAATKAGHTHGLNFTSELEDNLRLMQALSSVRALGFIKAMMNKNRMNKETPKGSLRAANLLTGVSMFLEQTLAFEKTHPKECLPMTAELATMHRKLSYYLAYLVRDFANHTFTEASGLSKLVTISAECVKLDEGFWDRFRALRTDPSQFAKQAGGDEGDHDHLGIPTGTTGSGGPSSAITSPITFGSNTVSPASAEGPRFVITRPTGFDSIPTQAAPPKLTTAQRAKNRVKNALGKGKKERERKEDDKWIDSRDLPDSNIIFQVRAPVHDNNFDDLLRLMQDVRITNSGEGSSAHIPHDDGTVFLTSPVESTHDGTPEGFFTALGISMADDGGIDEDGLYDMENDPVVNSCFDNARDFDSANPALNYSTGSAALHPDLVVDPITASPRTPGSISMPGPSTVDVDVETAIVPSGSAAPSIASGAPSESGSASCRPSSTRSSFISRSSSIRKGKDVLKRAFSRKG